MPAAHCPICLNDFAIDGDKPEFLIFPCGHGFCAGCTDKLFNDMRVKCPNCRKIIHRRDAHPVYLQLVDSKAVFATSVIEGMNQMDTDTPLVSVKKASQKLGKIVDMDPANDTLSLLLQAVQDFNERVIPLFTKVESQKKEIDRQRQDLQKARREKENVLSQLNKLSPLQLEVVNLRTALAETENNTQEAIRLAENAKDKLEAQCTVSAQWQKQAGTLEQENKRFIDLIQKHKTYGQKQLDKCRKLETELIGLRAQHNSREESQAMSDAAHEYDGDFSGHECTRVHTSLRLAASTPSRSSRHSASKDESMELDLEYMPPSGFSSDWQPRGLKTDAVPKKRASNGAPVSSHRRVTNAIPIDLDRKGRPTRAVYLGPRSIIRIGP